MQYVFPKGVSRALEHTHVDAYVVSAPKTGRTWLKVLLVKLFELRFGVEANFKAPLDFQLVTLEEGNAPGILFTHDLLEPHNEAPFAFDRERYKNKKVIFIVRDPRDVVVSAFYQFTKREGIFSGTLSDLVRDERFGIRHTIEFFNLWAQHRGDAGALHVMRYEDMLTDIRSELRKLCVFLDIGGCEPYFEEVASFGGFEEMQKREREGFFGSTKLMPRDQNDINTYKVRRGKVGGFVDELSPEDIAYANEECKRLDPFYGYAF